jgi:transketolase
MIVIRPCDANETLYAWKAALENKQGPTTILLTRQKLPTLDRNKYTSPEHTLKGAYILLDNNDPDCLLVGCGSEVEVLVKAADIVAQKGIKPRVISMPSHELFERQSAEYQKTIFPDNITKRYFLDVGISHTWHKYAGFEGKIHAYDRFGESGPYKELAAKYGFTPEKVAEEIIAYCQG